MIGEHLEARCYCTKEPVLHKLLLAIWTLSTPESFREVAYRFGYRNRGCNFISISKIYFDFVKYNCLRMHHVTGSAHHVLQKVCRILVQHSELFITWPAKNEYENISAQFSFPSALCKY